MDVLEKNIYPELINKIIAERRSIFPGDYLPGEIPRSVIQQILSNANWAPTHKVTEPWRFKVFTGDSLNKLGDFLAFKYRANTPVDKFLEKKYEKTALKPRQSACVIAVCMQRDQEEKIPEWEEIAAVSCAVQNMMLSCAAYGIGSYWSTPAAILGRPEILPLKPGEKCLGLLYMGYSEKALSPGKRGPVKNKTTWM